MLYVSWMKWFYDIGSEDIRFDDVRFDFFDDVRSEDIGFEAILVTTDIRC